MKEKAIIVDLDGTLCDSHHRAHHLTGVKKNWDGFYASMSEDQCNPWCAELIKAMSASCKIIFLTGRPSDYLRQTQEWLYAHSLSQHMLFMRPEGDYRPDWIVKGEIYQTYIEPNFDVLFCIDDRKQVVDAWRAMGLTCLQCAEGNF